MSVAVRATLRLIALLALVAGTILILAALAGPIGAASPDVMEATVAVQDFDFAPETVMRGRRRVRDLGSPRGP